VGDEISKGLAEYKQEVEARQFPATAHTFSMKPEEWEQAQRLIAEKAAKLDSVNGKLDSANGKLEHPNGKTENPSSKSEFFDKLAMAALTAAKGTGQAPPSAKGNGEKATTGRSQPNKKWEITNFDLYYNSYFQNNNSDAGELEFDHPNYHNLKLKN
jgi:hypothetical protein